MSGLFVRSQMNAGHDGFRDERLKQMSDIIEGHHAVGYSRLIGQDEAGSLACPKKHRR